jgi:dynactin complex subunit
MEGQPALNLGDVVVIMGKRKGAVRFIGPTAFGPGEWVGVELEKPTGTHDGCVNGQVRMYIMSQDFQSLLEFMML